MGWSSGSQIAVMLIDAIRENVSDSQARKAIYEVLIEEFENADCDTLCECNNIDYVFDELLISRDE